MRRRVVGGALAAVVAAALSVPAVSGAAEPQGGCETVDLTVPASVLDAQVVELPGAGALVGGGEDLDLSGTLCLPRGGAPETVMLALHGITYDDSYWNVGFEPETYNFSDAMTGAGYAVFALDRLGYGGSDRPPAAAVTLDVQAEVAHQVITDLRAGEVGGAAFEHVILVGHSYGTATSWRESAIHNDADAIIGTGWGNTIQTVPLARFFSAFVPAQVAEPERYGDVPPGYLTSLPGQRGQDYLYDLDNVDPELVTYDDEVLKDTVPAGEGATFYNRYGAVPVTPEIEIPLSGQAADITIPTFLVNGENELFFCGPAEVHCTDSASLQEAEGAYFSPQACFRAAVVPDAGHDLNLQRNAPFTYDTIITFADRVLGPDGDRKEDYLEECRGASAATGDLPEFGA
jgi:pimeloyl-ACP methyl ester carboxylesterase